MDKLEQGINTARIYIPRPSGYTTGGKKTFGATIIKNFDNRYKFWAMTQNIEVVSDLGRAPNITPADFKSFYDLVGAHYDVNVSVVPARRPYVQFVDYIQQDVGVVENEVDVISKLAQQHNVLIIANDAERKYLEHLYNSILYKGRAEYAPVCPPRFQAYVSKLVAQQSR